ncbi:uncharacterized protein LOC110748453 [Prunus avium]|uniref:Uncharacterized protein LOC110748453 n=1 Tax=Prunus avium TaxID=42229 RepID=A0A6P5RSZ5_PRUAV|nr:uncharacterized protein LOC110748453 [Prunus avium]
MKPWIFGLISTCSSRWLRRNFHNMIDFDPFDCMLLTAFLLALIFIYLWLYWRGRKMPFQLKHQPGSIRRSGTSIHVPMPIPILSNISHFLLRRIIRAMKVSFSSAALFHLVTFLFGSFGFVGLFMNPNGPNAEEIVAEADMGSVEDSHNEQAGPNLPQLRHEVKMCEESQRDSERLAQDSLERADALIEEANYRRSLPDQGPASQEHREELLAEAGHEIDYAESDLEMLQELAQDKADAIRAYNEALGAEYNRLRERETALREANERLRSQLK